MTAGLILLILPSISRSDTCLLDLWDNGSAQSQTVFPNWVKVPAAAFDGLLCSGCGAGTETIKGLTVVNFGTALGSDVAALYWKVECGATASPLYTLTYAGVYTADSGNYPAWTWAGTAIDLSACAASCVGCGGGFTLTLYADVDDCPTSGTTLRLGLPFRTAAVQVNALNDNNVCSVPWADLAGPTLPIAWVAKTGDLGSAAPGDTVTYTITWGRPGTAALSPVSVFDTLPAYTHYVPGSAVPAPDAGFDPNWGPPIALQWTLAGPYPTGGGPTLEIRYQVTVDWGNGEGFEPGSGDVAAPEGARLDNRSQVAFGNSTCAVTTAVNPPVTTVVHRFLFWQIGDNDVLFSPVYGQSPDEITYEIFLKNLSSTKTWWDVAVWDTVPPELVSWCQNCGFEDPCLGWTMTPGGCAAASPGRVVSGPSTLLTWRLDAPPGMTVSLRWKAQVASATTAGATAVNVASFLERGRTGIVGGTGNSGVPARFAHLAPVILPTTYVSYVAFAGSDTSAAGCGGFFLAFFPLNKRSQFELRGLQFEGAGWASTGGLSPSLGALLGDCLGGFPGGGGIPGGGQAGCKVERVPAAYHPTAWNGVCPTYPFHFVYKLTSNSPVLWQLLTTIIDDNWDQATFSPSTSLSYRGLMHYFWRRDDTITETPGYGESVSLIDTTLDAYGVPQANLPTTVHLFQWDATSLSWSFRHTVDLGHEGHYFDFGSFAADDGPWRIVSSDAMLVVEQTAEAGNTMPCCCSNCADQWGTLWPTREEGNVVSRVGAGTFYGLAQSYADPAKVIVGNTGGADATYRIWRYVPDTNVGPALSPPNLRGTSGSWIAVGQHGVPAGFANAGNPRIYDTFSTAFNTGSTALYKVELLGGGPIQILGGTHLFASYNNGSVLHAENGDQTGTAFWLHETFVGSAKTYADCNTNVWGHSTQTVDVFCPKAGMAVHAQSEDGYSATYTSNGPDQCVSFLSHTTLASPAKRNFRFSVGPPGIGNAIAQYNECRYGPKGFTAPFLAFGTHYLIVAPPTVFAGQSFWMTVIVLGTGGGTRTDYCGTTSFTSTDRGATVGGTGLDAFNFTWSSDPALGNCDTNGAAPNENGVRIFVNVVLTTLGLQTIIAADTADGSVTGLVAIMVVGADVKLVKTPALSVQASGDTVQFRVCWSNYSSASAFTFVVTDAVPEGTTFLPEAGTAALDCQNTNGVAPRVAYSTLGSATPPAAFTEANPVAGTRWLRWTVPQAGVNTTGCLCYRVTVN